MIEFRCQKCGAMFRLPDDHVGETATCQWCGHEQDVPNLSRGWAPKAIEFPCDHCGVALAMGPEYAGRKVRCSQCQQVVVVPAASDRARADDPPPPPPPPPPAPPPPESEPATKPLPEDEASDIIEFDCQFCGNPFRVSRELAGKKGKCQKCGAVNVVPKPQAGA